MTFDEVYDTLPTHGWLSKAEAQLLWDCAVKVRGDILEVGCYQGRSTVLLSRAIADPYIVYCVDPFDGFHSELTGDQIQKLWWDNIISRDVDNAFIFREKVETWLTSPVALAYLDGDHTFQGTVNQVRVAQQCGAKVIAVHDVNDTGDGVRVKDAAVGMLGPWDVRVERLAVWNR